MEKEFVYITQNYTVGNNEIKEREIGIVENENASVALVSFVNIDKPIQLPKNC